MSARHRPVTPWKFSEVLEAAGIIHDRDRISEFRIVCKPDDVVKIEVTYIADDRLLTLGSDAIGKPREKPARDDRGALQQVLDAVEGDREMLSEILGEPEGQRSAQSAVILAVRDITATALAQS